MRVNKIQQAMIDKIANKYGLCSEVSIKFTFQCMQHSTIYSAFAYKKLMKGSQML